MPRQHTNDRALRRAGSNDKPAAALDAIWQDRLDFTALAVATGLILRHAGSTPPEITPEADVSAGLMVEVVNCGSAFLRGADLAPIATCFMDSGLLMT